MIPDTQMEEMQLYEHLRDDHEFDVQKLRGKGDFTLLIVHQVDHVLIQYNHHHEEPEDLPLEAL